MRPFYDNGFCRYCSEPLDSETGDVDAVKHSRCESLWIAQAPHIPCALCECDLGEDEIKLRQTIHLSCEALLFSTRIPDWPIEQAKEA
jgi:hypothetical protein